MTCNVFGGMLNLTRLNCCLGEQMVLMSTTPSCFDQYCISHCTIVIKRLLNLAMKSAVSAP